LVPPTPLTELVNRAVCKTVCAGCNPRRGVQFQLPVWRIIAPLL